MAVSAHHGLGPVEPGPVGPARVDLYLDQRLALVAHHSGPDDRTFRTLPYERSVGGDPVTALGGDITDRLHEVGLAPAVRAHENTHPRPHRELKGGVRPEVGEGQMGDVHLIERTAFTGRAAPWCAVSGARRLRGHATRPGFPQSVDKNAQACG